MATIHKELCDELFWSALLTGGPSCRVKIERALEDQSLRTSQERRMTRILLSSEHTLQEIEQSGNIIAFRCTEHSDTRLTI